MKRLLPAGVAGTAIVTALVAVLCGTAVAYFTTTGAGSATAGLPKLSAPTISSALPAVGGTVALTWTAVTPPGSGTVTYTVVRDGDEPAGNCPTASSPGTATTCTDSGLEVGTHTYTVSAKWHSWTATSSSAQAKVTVGAAVELSLKAASTTPGAGVADNLTITALDEKGSTVTTYTGSHSLTFSGASSSPGGTAPTVANSSGTAVAFGSATAISFTLGVATVTSTKNGLMKLYRAGASEINVSEGSIADATPLAVTVAPGAASKLVLSAASTTPTAGTSDDLTTTAQDTYGNTATTYTGSRSLTFSGASASPSGEAPTVTDSSGAATAFGGATAINFNAGVASASGGSNGTMRLYKSGSTSLKVSDGTLTSAAAVVTVAAATAIRLSLGAASTTPIAAATDNLTTTALDPYGNTATAYTGSHNLVFSGANTSPSGAAPTVVNSAGTAASFGAATALNFTAGVATVASSKNGVMKLNKAEVASVSVSDGSISTVAGLTITVSTAAAARLSLTHVTVSAGSIGGGCLFTCGITGLGNGGTVKANVAVTDSVGNPISALGTGHAVKITATAGSTVAGTPLAIPSTGLAETATQFTYTSKSSGSFTDTITAATSEGTTYTSATATASK
jgi:hypothetical protein